MSGAVVCVWEIVLKMSIALLNRQYYSGGGNREIKHSGHEGESQRNAAQGMPHIIMQVITCSVFMQLVL